jgi:soluble lytic murein transglycosylase-like protein
MMESHLQAALARVQEIEARLGFVDSSAPSSTTTSAAPTALASSSAAKRPFDVMLAEAGGSVSLRPLGSATTLFAPQTEALISRYAAKNGLSPDLVRAVIQAESGGNAHSVSAVGAKGLMQLMPDTAQAYGVQDVFDPEQNIAAGTRHLAGLMREFNGDLPQALAAYNAGSAAVRKYGGVPPFAETQQYVHRILTALGHH